MVKICVWPSYGSSQSVEWIDLFNSSFANYWWKITQAHVTLDDHPHWSLCPKKICVAALLQILQTRAAYLGILTVDTPQCGNLAIFLPLWSYMKSILAGIRRSKIPFKQWWRIEGVEFRFFRKISHLTLLKFPNFQSS